MDKESKRKKNNDKVQSSLMYIKIGYALIWTLEGPSMRRAQRR